MGQVVEACGETPVKLSLHNCAAPECGLLLGDLPEEELVALVKDDLGTEIDYFHLSHAPKAIQDQHERDRYEPEGTWF